MGVPVKLGPPCDPDPSLPIVKATMAPQPRTPAGVPTETPKSLEVAFQDVLGLIRQSRHRVFRAVNAELMDLYWRMGSYVAAKVAREGWGQGTVRQLAGYLAEREPGIRGFSAQNLWRMRQFFETYQGDEMLSALLRALSWTHNLLILGKCKSTEERSFYLKLAASEARSSRQLEHQIEGCLFERSLSGKPKLSAVLRDLHPAAENLFKDRYVMDFLDLPDRHTERELQKGLVLHLKDFLLELGRDFCLIGTEYPLQVGARDFFIDLLLYHRGLQAMVAIELKIGEFEPEHLGKLDFYLEALDRDHRKPHEAPSIGMLLCKARDQDVVEYSLSRTLSPALVAEYQTKLPEKAVLQAKLEELYALASVGSTE
jgi:predicted nuclease of restriction endonuclease-like (RecB) superfamily